MSASTRPAPAPMSAAIWDLRPEGPISPEDLVGRNLIAISGSPAGHPDLGWPISAARLEGSTLVLQVRIQADVEIRIPGWLSGITVR